MSLEVEDSRELVGRLVRQVWVDWAREQTNLKLSWLVPWELSWLVHWEELDDDQREVDMRIGETLFNTGAKSRTEGGTT
jgi:hypothetical protein